MKTPRATYRLQLGPDFGLDAAAGLVDYLADLGVSHLYASPYLQAAQGSLHGYDVVDPTRVSRELGGEAAHQRLVAALERRGLGQLLDIVPNHMAISGPDNPLWWDVLESGTSSAFAHFFDIDWNPPEARLAGRVLLPILEDHYGRVLEMGLLRLRIHQGALLLRYRAHVFPLAPRSLPSLLGPAAEVAGSDALASLSHAFAALPEPPLEDLEGRRARHRELRALEGELRALLRSDSTSAAALEAVSRRTESNPDALDELLERQSYRLAYWRAGLHELDYRRFFDIDTLVALRVEDDEVFEHTHQRVLEWLRSGRLDGVRVDHVDGLRHPRGYLERLRREAPDAWIVAEKILGAGERVPDAWPVDGTTGYDFMNEVGALLVDPDGEEPLTRLYRELTGDGRCWRDVVVSAKRRALEELLAADLARLTHLFLQLCEGRRLFRDYTRPELRDALIETAAHLPIYRSYVDDEQGPDAQDREHVESALAGARRDRPDLDPELLALLRKILLAHGEMSGPLERELRLRFQQLTGAVTAKAVEDSAFYQWPRMAALNEVGGEPSRFGLSLEEFHRRNAERQLRWPRGMLALSTHDTKRSEDVRARLFLLSEVPERWGEHVRRWMERSERYRGGSPHPDRSIEYLLYQTLVGAHPLSPERALAYVEKAAREARAHTSWVSPDAEYEQALAAFVTALLAEPAFTAEMQAFLAPLRDAGWVNALAQKLVQLTVPGVPDLYQGSELWDLSLVDPDNRRAVDFAHRQGLLEELTHPERGRELSPERIWARREEGLSKLWLVRQALALRAERPGAFGPEGDYAPVPAEGSAADHVVAFSRGEEVISVVPRLTVRLEEAGGWKDTFLDLPQGRWSDRLTGRCREGGRVPIGQLLSHFPAALLVRG